MPNLSVLPFNHPTTIVLVDDDDVFLGHLSLALYRQGVLKTHASPFEALADIQANERLSSQILPVGRLPMVDDPRRFSLFSVLVTDYEMGAMNGMQLCGQLGANPLGRIMLTGKVDERHAVRAFNQDTIDRYVRKDDPEVIEVLKGFIGELKQQFFSRLVSSAHEDLIRGKNPFLYDPVFSERFHRYRRDNGIVEYYLGSDFPGYLLLDAKGEVLVFAVLTERQMAEHVEAAENCDAPRDMLDLLRAGLVIPFFPTRSGYYSREYAESWKDWTFTADLIEGKKRYYHSVVSGPAADGLFQGRQVYPYNRYLQEQAA